MELEDHHTGFYKLVADMKCEYNIYIYIYHICTIYIDGGIVTEDRSQFAIFSVANGNIITRYQTENLRRNIDLILINPNLLNSNSTSEVSYAFVDNNYYELNIDGIKKEERGRKGINYERIMQRPKGGIKVIKKWNKERTILQVYPQIEEEPFRVPGSDPVFISSQSLITYALGASMLSIINLDFQQFLMNPFDDQKVLRIYIYIYI